MPPSSNPPATAKPPSWTIAAVICGLAGLALIVASFIPTATQSLEPSRLTAPPDSATSGHTTPATPSDATPDPDEVVHVVAGFQPPPAWVPIYSDGVSPVHGTRRDDHGAIKGITTLETSDPLDKIKDYYKGKLTGAGFELTVDTSVSRVAEHAEITARKDGGKLTVRAIMHRTKGRTTVNVDYTDTGNAKITSAETSSPAIAAAASAIPAAPPAATPSRESVPVWVPVYPSIKGELHTTANPATGNNSGTLDFSSVDSVARIRKFYDARFKESGYSVDSGAGTPDGVESAVLKAKKDGGRFNALVTIKAEEGGTHITINFAGAL